MKLWHCAESAQAPGDRAGSGDREAFFLALEQTRINCCMTIIRLSVVIRVLFLTLQVLTKCHLPLSAQRAALRQLLYELPGLTWRSKCRLFRVAGWPFDQ